MNIYAVWLFVGIAVILIIGVGSVFVVEHLRKRDFQDQVTGKKPERKAKEGDHAHYPESEAAKREDPLITADREGLRMKGGQNLFGGH
jgi:hypothetical protein